MSVNSGQEPDQNRWVGMRHAYNGDEIQESASATSGSTTLYTVPAGKQFLLYEAILNTASGSGNNCYLGIKLSGGALKHYLLIHNTASAFYETYYHITFNLPLVLDAGDFIEVYNIGAGNCYGFIHGVECLL